MQHPSWVTTILLCIIALLAGVVVAPYGGAPAAEAQASEGRTEGIIAVSSTVDRGSLLYLVDTEREVILLYGFHSSGSRTGGTLRTGYFEFLAGRLYRWDALLATKREYSLKGVNSLQGLRVFGPDGAQGLVDKDGR
ncbi:hypothetical protein HQ576_02540 [bacterium]|nr:hypothetical protein [bacterium]